MKTINNRIKILVDVFAEGNKSEFAKKINTSEANVRNYISGTQPKYEVLASIMSSFVQVSPDWLMNGKGKMYRAQNDGTAHLFETSYEKTETFEKIVDMADFDGNDYAPQTESGVIGGGAITENNTTAEIKTVRETPYAIDGKVPIADGLEERERKYISVYPLLLDRIKEQQIVPLYSIEATAGLVSLFADTKNQNPIDYLKIPNLPPCDGALRVTGDSMYPIIKSGDIVVYKQINDIANNIFWGEMYLVSLTVDDEEFIALKYIQRSEQGSDHIKLVSHNEHHQPRDIRIDRIRALAFVKASIRMNSMT